jgi:hypothetical protein
MPTQPEKDRQPERLTPLTEAELQAHERFEDELVMHLEHSQFVAETSRAVPKRDLGARARSALWALRIFAILVSAMVIYTFIDQLH